MIIEIEREHPSVYIHDENRDYRKMSNGHKELHISLRCRHENISYDLDLNDIFCPDCFNKHLSHEEHREYLRAYSTYGDDERQTIKI